VRDVDNFRRDDPLGQVEVDVDDYVAKGEKLNVTLQNGTGSIFIQKTIPVKFRLYARLKTPFRIKIFARALLRILLNVHFVEV